MPIDLIIGMRLRFSRFLALSARHQRPESSSEASELERRGVLSALRGSTALDTSAVIEFLTGTDLGRVVKEYFETLKPDEKVYCSLYSLSETFYVLCRLKGSEFAVEKMKLIMDSRVIQVENGEEMAMEAGKLKCERAISIGDCGCIATAKISRSRAVFAQKEKELVNEMRKKPFGVEILFLSELIKSGTQKTD